MFSHVMIGSNDLDRSKRFYDATFDALGAEPGLTDAKGRLIHIHGGAFLTITRPIDGQPASAGNGATVGIGMVSRAQADAWHDAGVAGGGTSVEDAPGLRGDSNLYLAYPRDPDGNKLCALLPGGRA